MIGGNQVIVHDFRDLIKSKYYNLSKGQQKVASLVLEDSYFVALNPASEIGKQIGVSETTVIRFCYSLDLKGFSELQTMLREQLWSAENSLENFYKEKLELAGGSNFYTNVMKKDCSKIQETILYLNEQDIHTAVQKLTKADNIYVSGMRASFGAAHWLSFALGIIKDPVYLYRQDTDDLYQVMNQIKEKTAVIAISFHRYAKETVHFAELAKKRGAFIISLTDSPISPIAKYSDCVIHLFQAKRSTLDAAPSLFSVMNAIVSGVSVKMHDQFKQRQKQFDLLEIDDMFYME